MSLLCDPAYIVHNLRLSNLRLKDRTSGKIITLPLQISNEYIKAAGPVSPEGQHAYSPNINHDYLMFGNNTLLLGADEPTTMNSIDNTPTQAQPVKQVVGRVKSDRRRVVAAQAAAAAVAAGFGRGGNEGTSNAVPVQPAPVPAARTPVPMAAASLESDDDIDDLDDEELVKSPPGMLPKMAIPAHVGGGFPGIFITTPSRPGSATIPDDVHAQRPINASEGESGQEETETNTDLDLDDATTDSVATAKHMNEDPITAVNSLASPLPLPPNTSSSSSSTSSSQEGADIPPADELLRPKPVLFRPSAVSLLSSLITQQKTKDENPFAEEFLKFAGTGEPNPVQLKIYLPHSEKPKDPMQVFVKRDATVEDVIGYILYQYCYEGRTPQLSDEQSTVVQWNMRIVEDDGEIDDDLPAVDRAQKIGKFATASRFSMNQFALCEATPAQVQINEQQYVKSGRTVTRPKRQQSATSPTSPAPPSSSKGGLGLQGEAKPNLLSGKTFVEPSGTNGALSSAATTAVSPGMGTSANVQISASTQHYIRVRILTDHEVKHTTTVEILPKMLVSGVINYICNKRRMNPSEWMLVVEDTQTILPLDGAAEDISSTTELSLVHKSNEANFTSRRGRPGMGEIPGSSVSYLTSTEVYREYTLNRKRRGGYVGHHEQILAIDGDYIRILPSSNRTLLFDSGKTASYLRNTIHDCRQSKKAPSHFKLVVNRDRERKVYEYEAKTPQQAQEICQRIMQLKDS